MEFIKEFAQSVLLGIVQGVTEFIPVSSSGHLEIAKRLLGFEANELFTILLHVATLCAVCIVFRKKIIFLFAALFRTIFGGKKEGDEVAGRLWLLLIGSTAVTVVIALVLKVSKLLDAVQANPKPIAICFLITGIVLVLTVFFKGTKDYRRCGVLEGLLVGAAQGIGVLPGISRSGLTISTALGAGMSKETAAEYSFLLSIPAILGALVLDLKDASDLLLKVSIPALVAGIAAAFLAGLGSIFILLKLIRKGRLYLFSMYLIPLGILILIFM